MKFVSAAQKFCSGWLVEKVTSCPAVAPLVPTVNIYTLPSGALTKAGLNLDLIDVPPATVTEA